MTKRSLLKHRSTPRMVLNYMRSNCDNTNNYIAYLEYDKEPIIRTWAFKKTKARGFEYTEVEREALNMIYWKNLRFTGIAGYQVCYSPREYFDFDEWEEIEKPIGVTGRMLNLEALYQGKFQYCGYQPRCGDLMRYLRLYELYPEVEYLGKLGVKVNISIIRKCKDKQFVRFLLDRAEDIKIYGGYPETLLYAYKNKLEILVAQHKIREKKWAESATRNWTNIKTPGLDRVRIANFAYNKGMTLYRDYWEAINGLGLDIMDTKNVFPKDFDRMHDLRIDEWESIKAKQDAKKKTQLSKQIKKVSEKYKPSLIENENLCVILPTKVMDFKREGKELHHCVGKMGYDKKMAEERSLIAFIRKKDQINTPYVTAEVVLTGKPYLSQVYGDHDSIPAPEVEVFAKQFVDEVKKLRKVRRRKHEKVNS